MGVGLPNKNIVAIIQARFGSTRLPGKILLPLPFNYGKPIIQHVAHALRRSKTISKIIIATSIGLDNNVIKEFADSENLDCFRGDENDVLSRFISVAIDSSADVIVRITGDNPFIDVNFLDSVILSHIENQNDYTKSKGMPLGMNVEVINSECLIGLKDEELEDADREHVTRFIHQNDKYKCGEFVKKGRDLSYMRCTIDYASDYAMFNLLFQVINMSNLTSETLEKIELSYPWILQVNSFNLQQK